MGERVESMNAMPAMFQAGISSKFTKRRGDNFHDTTLSAASAAKLRAEKRAEKQAEAIDKQQQKIESEMKKIEEITQRLHRQQVREAKRLRDRLHFAATRVQRAFRQSCVRRRMIQCVAAVRIQSRWRYVAAQAAAYTRRMECHRLALDCAAHVITRYVRRVACRFRLERLVLERDNAATLIQSIARMAQAKRIRRQLQCIQQQQRAAVCLQSHVRGFMTRLIYLDVLYVIGRIQAVARGFLIRRRLRWVASIDIDAIRRFQALVRGFLVRQQQQMQRSVLASSRSSDSSIDGDDNTDTVLGLEAVSGGESLPIRHSVSVTDARRGREPLLRARARPAARPTEPPQPVEAAVKRSYWLPAGASFNKRLPVLPLQRVAVVATSESDVDDVNADDSGVPDVQMLHARTANAMRGLGARTPKKRNQRNRPPRLAPVTLTTLSNSSSSNSSGCTSTRMLTDAESDLEHVNRVLAERLQREDALKHKLLSRKLHERRRLEHEQRLRREQESEDAERKLMEREEKLARLLLKVQHRRSKAVQIKRQSVEQQREERERIAMAREERQTRLLLKLAARHGQLKRSVVASANAAVASRAKSPVRVRDSRSRTELHHGIGTDATTKRSDHPQDSNDDSDDMSFLDIDFKIPTVMMPKPRTTRVGAGDAGRGKQVKRKDTRRSHRGSSSSAVSQTLAAQTSANAERSSTSRSSNNQDDVGVQVGDDNDAMQDDDGCDYGSEFEEIVDEAKLARLIC